MKTILKKFTYTAFGFIFAIAAFSMAHTASANTYVYNCVLNPFGNVTTDAWINPVGPFSTTPSFFQAYGRITTNNCHTDNISLGVKNNNGTEYPLIPSVVIGPNETVPFGPPASTVPMSPDFKSPSGQGTYTVHFATVADEIGGPPLPPASCSAYVRFVGRFRFGGVKWIGPAQHPQVIATVAIVGNAAYGITTGNPPGYVNFTIPANSSQSTMGEFYGVLGYDHGWVDHTDLSWACGDATQNYSTCFVSDTKVDMADGTKKDIQDVEVGDVLKGEKTNNTVLGFHRPELDGKVYSFNGGRYFVTEEHPFKTTDGWKSINPKKTMIENIGITVTDLEVGDTLVTDTGLVKLDSIDGKEMPGATPLYNFKLDGDHTYYADGYLVHNKQFCDGTTTAGDNKPCIDYSGYRIMDPNAEGTIPVGCNYQTAPTQRPFCYGSQYGTAYCPTPAGACN